MKRAATSSSARTSISDLPEELIHKIGLHIVGPMQSAGRWSFYIALHRLGAKTITSADEHYYDDPAIGLFGRMFECDPIQLWPLPLWQSFAFRPSHDPASRSGFSYGIDPRQSPITDGQRRLLYGAQLLDTATLKAYAYEHGASFAGAADINEIAWLAQMNRVGCGLYYNILPGGRLGLVPGLREPLPKFGTWTVSTLISKGPNEDVHPILNARQYACYRPDTVSPITSLVDDVRMPLLLFAASQNTTVIRTQMNHEGSPPQHVSRLAYLYEPGQTAQCTLRRAPNAPNGAHWSFRGISEIATEADVSVPALRLVRRLALRETKRTEFYSGPQGNEYLVRSRETVFVGDKPKWIRNTQCCPRRGLGSGKTKTTLTRAKHCRTAVRDRGCVKIVMHYQFHDGAPVLLQNASGSGPPRQPVERIEAFDANDNLCFAQTFGLPRSDYERDVPLTGVALAQRWGFRLHSTFFPKEQFALVTPTEDRFLNCFGREFVCIDRATGPVSEFDRPVPRTSLYPDQLDGLYLATECDFDPGNPGAREERLRCSGGKCHCRRWKREEAAKLEKRDRYRAVADRVLRWAEAPDLDE